MKSVDFQILSNLLSTNAAQVSYHISYETNLIGTLERDTLMNLQLEGGGEWKINWDPSMMLPELADGNYLELVLTIPTRGGNIYSSDASNNYPLVAYTDAASLTIIPGKINPAQEDKLVSFLAELTNQTEDAVRLKYAYAQSNWSVVIGDISAEVAAENSSRIERFDGLYLQPFKSRFYYDNGIAPPHVTGYMLGISAEDQERYQRLGYKIDETVGASGLERWGGEKYLAGKRGADLYVKTKKAGLSPSWLQLKLSQRNPLQPPSTVVCNIGCNGQWAIGLARSWCLSVIPVRSWRWFQALVLTPTFLIRLFTPIMKYRISFRTCDSLCITGLPKAFTRPVRFSRLFR